MAGILQGLGHLAGGTRFRRISEKLYQDGDSIYRNAGIPFKASWFSVYYVLARSQQPMTIMGIAKQIDFTHISVKNVLRELEKEGLVSIQVNPADKRSRIAMLSKAGIVMLEKVEPIWRDFTRALKSLYDSGHPDLLNILDRIDRSSDRISLSQRVANQDFDQVRIVDYRPDLKHHFYELAAPWLKEVLGGNLEEEDTLTLSHPEKAYLQTGGFLFFALYKEEVVGCVVLKRLDKDTFEFAKLFIKPTARKMGLATRLIERCITRCMENEVRELWLQTTLSMPQAHQLYYKLGFQDRPAPPQMDVLQRTEKTMCKQL